MKKMFDFWGSHVKNSSSRFIMPFYIVFESTDLRSKQGRQDKHQREGSQRERGLGDYQKT